MITRLKVGIYKLKFYLTTLLGAPSEPTLVAQALINLKWY